MVVSCDAARKAAVHANRSEFSVAGVRVADNAGIGIKHDVWPFEPALVVST